MALKKKTYINGQTVISAENLNDIQDEIIGTKTANGTVVSQNADFAEVAEWDDGNPNNEDRTGYFVCANVPLNGIVMKKATSLDDVKGVSILAPAFAGNYTADKLDSEGNLLPKYSFVAVLGFVPVIDNGTCTVGGRCMPDDNGCAIPSSNSMGYQVVNRIDENRVLIIIEPNGDMVQRIKTRVNELQEDIDNLAPDQHFDPTSPNAQSGIAVEEAVSGKADIEKWELLHDVTTTEEVDYIRLKVDCKEIYLEASGRKPESYTSGIVQIFLQPVQNGRSMRGALKSMSYDSEGKLTVQGRMWVSVSGRVDTEVNADTGTYGYSSSYIRSVTSQNYAINGKIDTVHLNIGSIMGIGTNVKIWGLEHNENLR